MRRSELCWACLCSSRARHVFDAEEIRLVQAFADQAAIALENSRLYGELQAALTQVERSQQQIVRPSASARCARWPGGWPMTSTISWPLSSAGPRCFSAECVIQRSCGCSRLSAALH